MPDGALDNPAALAEAQVAAKDVKGSAIRGKALLYSISLFSSLGVFLFGYDQGVMSGIITQPAFKAYFNEPTSIQIGTMVSVLEIGAFITSLMAGWLADKKGRKFTIGLGALVFVIGGTIQTFTGGFYVMVVGRVISGFGVGMLSMIVPIYQSEVSPAHDRGFLGCVEFTGNIVGYASSVWIDYFCSYLSTDASWRIPLSIQGLIGLILAFGSFFIPESPRFLIDVDRDVEGLKVIADLAGAAEDDLLVLKEYNEIKDVVMADRLIGDRSYTALWTRYRGRVLIAMSSQAFAQLNGINVISYYAPLVFEEAGWIGRQAILMTGINGLIYILSTIPTWFLVDILGRRIVLMSGSVTMAIALSLLGYFMYLDLPFTPTAVVVCVFVYNAAFGASWGPLPWLYPPEIMPLAFRAKGVSLSTATNWASNFVVGEMTPLLQDLIAWRLYPMHAFFCVCSGIVVYFLYPETCGVPLEEMNTLFGDEGDDQDSEAGDDEEGYDDEDDDEYEEDDDLDEESRLQEASGSRKPSPTRSRRKGWFDWARRGSGKGNYSAVDDR